jgi:hypothetical protein
MPASNDPLATGNASDTGVLLDLPRVQGVDPADPAGKLPENAKQNGIVCIIPRWPAFPTNERIDRVEIFIVGNSVPIAQRDYGVADDAAEFLIPIGPTLLPDLPTFEIMYTVRSVNNTTSPSRRLTFASQKVLKEATFPDANLWGYINCTKNNPQDPESLYVWEGVRILIPFDDRFKLWDVIELVWQGWDSLNGSGTALTPKVTFTESVTDVINKKPVSIVIRPFDPHIEPLRDKDSATVSYLLLRSGVPIFSSFTGLVKIDRVIPGISGFCSDASWMK